MRSLFAWLQPLGRALMLPIAVLPLAGLLLRLGQGDLLNIPLVAAAGDGIFANLGLIFAIGLAVGLAKDNNGAAALAGAVCFLVATAGARTLIRVPESALHGLPAAAREVVAAGVQAKALAKLSVPLGILAGAVAGELYNRYATLKLPEALAFFGGRRFVPIASGAAGVILAVVFGAGWAGLSAGMDGLSQLIVRSGPFGLFAYGLLNRLLIVTGLHHILNNVVWFLVGDYHGATGDLSRFFAGDPSAGAFMAGFFPVMMFGLPAACLAMYGTARPERRAAVGGMLLSMALTACLTGVTEPIEFSFMFLAPLLFAAHAVLTGAAMVLMNALGVKLGFGFSAGLIDYLLNFSRATRPLVLIPVGAAYGVLYYGVFRYAILRFDLKTPGRERDPEPAEAPDPASGDRPERFITALGGPRNLLEVASCTTRLRVTLADGAKADDAQLRALGARGLVRLGPRSLQVVLGPLAEQLAGEMRRRLAGDPAPSPSGGAGHAEMMDLEAVLQALGGAGNVMGVQASSSRLRVEVDDGGSISETALRVAGARAVARPSARSVHVVTGPGAESLATDLTRLIGGRGRSGRT